MDLRRATLASIVLYTCFVLLDMYMFSETLITQSTAMALLGAGCAFVCLPFLAALQSERRHAPRQRIK